MQAMELHSPCPVTENPLILSDHPIPEPAKGQIRLRVRACGICHTDLHIVEGELELTHLPIIPGHQIVGKVEKLGKNTSRFQIGDRVGTAWLNRTCRQCEYCQHGQENLCPNARFTGLQKNGGYSEYVVVEEDFTYPLPSHFSDTDAAPLLCAGIIGYRSLRLSEIKHGGKLGLYGFGASAHLAIQVARHWGCKVYVFTRGDEHRKLAMELGAEWVGSAEDKPPVSLDASITFAPAGWIITHALSHLRPGGTLAINAIHMSSIPELRYRLIYGERTLRSVTNFTRSDAMEFLHIAGEISIHTEVEIFRLEEANTALQLLKNSKIRGAGVLKI